MYMLDPNKRYLIILADRQRGKYFTIYMDVFENEGEETFDEDVPQKVKAEHTRPGRVQSHIEDHLHRHFKQVGESALNFLIKNRIRRIDGVIIGGHKEVLHLIKKFLPSRLEHLVIAEFVTNVDVPIGDLTEKLKI